VFFVTGSVNSGTTLVSLYLEHLGISMMGDTRRSKLTLGVWEDGNFFNLLSDIIKLFYPKSSLQIVSQKRKELIRLIELYNKKTYWGFKFPHSILIADFILSALLEIVEDVTVIHLFRDLDETIDSWKRRDTLTNEKFSFFRILEIHESALRAYSGWKQKCNFHIVYTRDIIEHPEEFFNLLDIPLAYKPLDDIRKKRRFRPAVSHYTFDGNKRKNFVYDLLWSVKWKP